MNSYERALMPDYLRLFALFGIVVVNVQYIAFPAFQNFAEPVGKTFIDALTLWLINGLALLKTYGLFSFMFGVGLGFMMQSIARRGLSLGRIYRNRMIGLFLLGMIHGCLFFPGDILVIYAVTGSILYYFRNFSARRLVYAGVSLLIAQWIVTLPLLLDTSEIPASLLLQEQKTLTEGDYLSTVLFRSMSFAILMPLLLIIQGLSALGWFCLGLAAVRTGMIDDANHPLWQYARRLCFLPGLLLSLLGAGLLQWGPNRLGAALTIIAAPMTTLGYLGIIALISRHSGPIMARALTVGGSSLSIYLGQSIILSGIFSAYGLDLWDKLSRLMAASIAVLVTFTLMFSLSIWLTRNKQGPFEWLLRQITYYGISANRT